MPRGPARIPHACAIPQQEAVHSQPFADRNETSALVPAMLSRR